MIAFTSAIPAVVALRRLRVIPERSAIMLAAVGLFPGSGRTEEYHVRQVAGIDHSAEYSARSDEVFLPDHVVKPMRSDPVGERLIHVFFRTFRNV